MTKHKSKKENNEWRFEATGREPVQDAERSPPLAKQKANRGRRLGLASCFCSRRTSVEDHPVLAQPHTDGSIAEHRQPTVPHDYVCPHSTLPWLSRLEAWTICDLVRKQSICYCYCSPHFHQKERTHLAKKDTGNIESFPTRGVPGYRPHMQRHSHERHPASINVISSLTGSYHMHVPVKMSLRDPQVRTIPPTSSERSRI